MPIALAERTPGRRASLDGGVRQRRASSRSKARSRSSAGSTRTPRSRSTATSEGDEPDGVWTVEMTAPNVLINEGWTRTALKVGDKVTMFVNPLRNTSRAERRQHGLAVRRRRPRGRQQARPDRRQGRRLEPLAASLSSRASALNRRCMRRHASDVAARVVRAAALARRERQPAARVLGRRAGAAQMHHRRERLLLLERRA